MSNDKTTKAAASSRAEAAVAAGASDTEVAVAAGVSDAEAASHKNQTEVLPAVGEVPSPEEETTRVARLGVHRRLLWALTAAVFFAAAVFIAWRVLPPRLSQQQALADIDAPSIGAGTLTRSLYASNSGYELVDQTLVSLSDNGAGHKLSQVELRYKNSSFEVVVHATQEHELVGRLWKAEQPKVTDISAQPIAGVDGARLIADISTVLGKVAPHEGVSLAKLYEGGEFEAAASTLELDDTGRATSTVTIRAAKLYDLVEYHGTIDCVLEFEPGATSSDAGSWKLVEVSANEETWQSSLASLTGEWQGRLENTSTSALVLGIGRCFAGEDIPFVMTVHSFDASSGKLVCSMEFISHNHESLAADAEQSAGDARVRVEHVNVLLDPQTLEGSWMPSGVNTGQGAYAVSFENRGGVWCVRVTSGLAENGLWSFLRTTFSDSYVLSRA